MYDVSVVIPVYNEKDNIVNILHEITNTFELYKIRGEIIVVDDNSPDNTAKLAGEFARNREDVRVVVRTKDRGLSQSVVEGFHFSRSDIFVVIDADFSHPVVSVVELYKKIIEGYTSKHIKTLLLQH